MFLLCKTIFLENKNFIQFRLEKQESIMKFKIYMSLAKKYMERRTTWETATQPLAAGA